MATVWWVCNECGGKPRGPNQLIHLRVLHLWPMHQVNKLYEAIRKRASRHCTDVFLPGSFIARYRRSRRKKIAEKLSS